MQDDAADQLHIEVHHVPRHRLVTDFEGVLPLGQATRRIFYNRERFGQNLVELLPSLLWLSDGGQFLLPSGGLRPQIVVGERFELLIQRVNSLRQRPQPFDLALILGAENFL